MTINRDVRKLWAEKTLELTNIGAGALLFGQFISDKRFSLPEAFIGICFILIGYIASLVLLSKK